MADKIEKRIITCSIGKGFDGDFRAILSDTSIDRDDEFMSQELLGKWASEPNQFLPMLMDHSNKVENLIGKWNNAQIAKSGDKHHALTMIPKFFDANPKANMVKGMLEEGAQLGLSIGARPIQSEEVQIDGKTYRKWTDAELLEASITPIPSNKNSYLSLAKSFNLEKTKEEKMADKEIKKQEVELAEPETTEPETTEPETTEEETEVVEESEEEVVEEKEDKSAKDEKDKKDDKKEDEDEDEDEETSKKTIKSTESKSEYKAQEEPEIKKELEINSVFDALALTKGMKPNKWGEN